jgi:hypothetical protein
MSEEVTPGAMGRVFCPRCGETVFFTIAGGPRELGCSACKVPFFLDVVHNGRRWTVRRVRSHGSPGPG